MGVLRKQALEAVPSSSAIFPATQKKPVAGVPANGNLTPPHNSAISIHDDPPRRGPIPLEWLDLQALTQYAAVSRRTLTEWLYRPENPLPACRIGGKVYVRRADFDRWMESHPVEGPVNLGKIVDDVMADLQESE